MVVVSFLRARGHKVIMLLDDGIEGHQDLSLATKKTLCKLGFLLADKNANGNHQPDKQWFKSRHAQYFFLYIFSFLCHFPYQISKKYK